MKFIQISDRRLNFAFSMLALAASSTLITGIAWGLPASVSAQNRPDIQVAQTLAIRATSAQDQTLYLNNDRTYNYNLVTSQPTRIGNLNVPAGSTIRGSYQPAKGGLRYVANAVVVNGRSYNLNAVSDVLEDVKDPRDTSAGAIAGDAGIGAAGGLIIGEIFGDADIEEILGGAAAGAAVGNVTADRVVEIKPDRDIVLYSR